MFLFSPPRCELIVSQNSRQQTIFTSPRFSLPLWPTRPASSLVALRSLQPDIPPPASHSTLSGDPVPKPTKVMSSPHDIHVGTPRSPPFSPTLGSIPEVFEYETAPGSPGPISPVENQDIPVFALPDAATPITPSLSRGQAKDAIILNPRRATASRAATRVANVLRSLLEADRLRRRRALRIYLKAIVFLKLLLKSHERYGALMATSGMYMQR